MKKRLDARQVYVIRELTTPNTSGGGEPQVFIETVKGGEITFGVRAQGRQLARVLEDAKAKFADLRAFVRDQRRLDEQEKSDERAGRLEKSLEKQKEMTRP